MNQGDTLGVMASARTRGWATFLAFCLLLSHNLDSYLQVPGRLEAVVIGKPGRGGPCLLRVVLRKDNAAVAILSLWSLPFSYRSPSSAALFNSIL